MLELNFIVKFILFSIKEKLFRIYKTMSATPSAANDKSCII